jgi:hypothetical protein
VNSLPDDEMTQVAPFPGELDWLVAHVRYRTFEGWSCWLENMIRDRETETGKPLAAGLTLVIQRCGPDSYHPDHVIAVDHYFPVPPATYDRRSWQRWLFERFLDVERHEAMEMFKIVEEDPGGYINAKGEQVKARETRPYAPSHGPGNDPYLIREVGTRTDQQTSFRGTLNPR